MRRQGEGIRLDVAGLLAHGSLRSTHPLYQTPESALIDGVVIVSQLDAIQRISPNTVVVLSSDLGSGGWVISAALRHSWERKASALIVAGSANSEAVIGLAERLGITILATDQDPSSVALNLAGEIGASKSVVDTQIARFARTVARESTIKDIIQETSRELDGVFVGLEAEGILLASAGTAGSDSTEASVVVRGLDESTQTRLLARITRGKTHSDYLVHAILEVAAPSVQAAWLSTELADRRDSIPTVQIIEPGPRKTLAWAASEASQSQLFKQLGWRPEQEYGAVWIGAGSMPHGAQRTAVVRLLWRKVAPRRTLAEVPDGWLSVVPCESTDELNQLETRIRTRLGPALADLGCNVGLSHWHPENTDLPTSVQEARLASKCAERLGPGSVLSFGSIGTEAAENFIEPSAIQLAAELALPQLFLARDRAQVISTVKTFLDNQGSVTNAAKALDVHRNTLQTRLNRARELGLPMDDPKSALSMHLILNVLMTSLNIDPTDSSSAEERKATHD